MNQPFPTYRFHGRHRPPESKPAIRAEVPSDTSRDAGVAVLRIYDPIDSWGEFWGVSAKEFAQVLDEIGEVDEIRLHINSPGGDVFEGITIVNALRSHPARIVAVVDGLAASIASSIACSADELVMSRNSELMIHDAWGVCVGNAADMRDLAGTLDHVSDNVAGVYVDKAGQDAEFWRGAMLAETWYSADEAVAAGLADRVDRPATDEAAAKDRFDLSAFAFAGRDSAPEPMAAAAPDDSPSDEAREDERTRADQDRHRHLAALVGA